MFRDPKLIPTTPPDPDGERQRQSDDASWFSFQSELWKGVVWEVVAIAGCLSLINRETLANLTKKCTLACQSLFGQTPKPVFLSNFQTLADPTIS